MMLKRFASDCRGSMAVTAVLTLPVMLGVGAFAVDVSYFYVVKDTLQTAADAGALAAGQHLGEQTTARKAALDLAEKNVPGSYGKIAKPSDVVFGYYDPETKAFTPGATPVNAVQVTAARDSSHGNRVPWILGAALGFTDTDIRATSIVASAGSGACLISLDKTSGKSFSVSGSGSVNVPNCGIHVNSSSNVALSQQGASNIEATSIRVVGNYQGSNYSVKPETKQEQLEDPLASIPEPTIPGGCTYTNETFSVPMTLPGGSVYCGLIKFNADITFGPGIHYFKAALVTTGSNVDIVGKGVMLYFDAYSTLSSTSNGKVSLEAMSSGPYRGIAIFGSRSNGFGYTPVIRMTGGKDYVVNGTIYTPRARFELYGNADVTVTGKSGYVVAYQFYYQGNSSFTFDAQGGAGPATAFGPQRLALVR